jgi:hypothetical protein
MNGGMSRSIALLSLQRGLTSLPMTATQAIDIVGGYE